MSCRVSADTPLGYYCYGKNAPSVLKEDRLCLSCELLHASSLTPSTSQSSMVKDKTLFPHGYKTNLQLTRNPERAILQRLKSRV